MVVVTATNGGGSATETSAPTAAVTADPPVNTVPPSVTGTPADGGTVTADPGTWTGTLPIDFAYQWQRCDADGTNCTDIPGATDETYSPTAADVGHPIVVVVTATNPGATATQASEPSDPTLPAPPVNTTPPPAPTGTTVDGGTLTAGPGTWTGDGPITYTYQWQRCDADGTHCTDIADATDETYSPTGADVGHAIVVEVTATNPGGSTTEASAPTAGPIAAAPPVNTVPPTITGTPADGGTLTADPGTWTGTLPIDYGYQWQQCDADGTNCTDIPGATDDTYTPDDRRHRARDHRRRDGLQHGRRRHRDRAGRDRPGRRLAAARHGRAGALGRRRAGRDADRRHRHLERARRRSPTVPVAALRRRRPQLRGHRRRDRRHLHARRRPTRATPSWSS